MVLASVQQNGLALQYASQELWADREIVLQAAKQNALALESAAAQRRADILHSSSAWIGEHRQGGRPFLQPPGQGAGITAVQADPFGFLPGCAQAGEGQLHGGGCWVET